jgi:psp operon transcriptional activator
MKKAPEILGESEVILDLLGEVNRVAGIDRPVLVLGERGTGKELVASRLHFLSERWGGPFLTMNCGSITESLVETELFGYEAGAFTGAARQRPGRFEAADGGTLFLDEIGLLPLSVQEKILRVLEYGVFFRVGGVEEVQVDVRVIGATHADLESMVGEGKFKADLLDRLGFEALEVPPLRERGADVELLAGHFIRRMSVELKMEDPPMLDDVMVRGLRSYAWPGNVRELKNVVERAVARSPSNLAAGLDFTPLRRRWPAPGRNGAETSPDKSMEAGESEWLRGHSGFREKVEELEKRLLAEALEQSGGNRKRAAEALQLTYHQLRALMRKHGHDPRLGRFIQGGGGDDPGVSA